VNTDQPIVKIEEKKTKPKEKVKPKAKEEKKVRPVSSKPKETLPKPAQEPASWPSTTKPKLATKSTVTIKKTTSVTTAGGKKTIVERTSTVERTCPQQRLEKVYKTASVWRTAAQRNTIGGIGDKMWQDSEKLKQEFIERKVRASSPGVQKKTAKKVKAVAKRVDLSWLDSHKISTIEIHEYNRKEFESLADNYLAVPWDPIIKILFAAYLFVHPYKDNYDALID